MNHDREYHRLENEDNNQVMFYRSAYCNVKYEFNLAWRVRWSQGHHKNTDRRFDAIFISTNLLHYLHNIEAYIFLVSKKIYIATKNYIIYLRNHNSIWRFSVSCISLDSLIHTHQHACKMFYLEFELVFQTTYIKDRRNKFILYSWRENSLQISTYRMTHFSESNRWT